MLSNREVNYMKRKARKLTQITEVQIKFKTRISEDYSYGYGEEEYEWSDEWKTYKCSTSSVDKYNIDEYPFGNIVEGDLILLFPDNTTLPDAEEYEIKLGDDIYVSKTDLQKMAFVGNQYLYKVLAGELK